MSLGYKVFSLSLSLSAYDDSDICQQEQSNSIEQMIKDYFLKIKDLRQDRLLYQTEKQKNTLTTEMNRQEDKYQAYIIQQMNEKNKIMAAVQIVSILNVPLKLRLSQFVGRCASNHVLGGIQGRKLNQSHSSSRNGSNQLMINEVQKLLLKYSLNAMLGVVHKKDLLQKRQAFGLIIQKRQISKKMERSRRVIYKYSLRVGWSALKEYQKQKQRAVITYHNIFQEDFSVIYKEDPHRRQKGNIDESYLSFMLEKENIQTEPHSCRNCKAMAERDRQLTKMKEQVNYLKTLLSQKNIEIMKKDELCKKLQVGITDSEESQFNQSKNSSYYNELDKYVMGSGKRIRKNVSRMSENSNPMPLQQISKELLSKYMKESFQLKEMIDVARQLCLELRGKVGVTHRAHILQLIKLLSFGDEVSMIDEY